MERVLRCEPRGPPIDTPKGDFYNLIAFDTDRLGLSLVARDQGRLSAYGGDGRLMIAFCLTGELNYKAVLDHTDSLWCSSVWEGR